jgi:hypothetical protein
MAVDKCLERVKQALKRSSLNQEEANNILDKIKKAQIEQRIDTLDEIKLDKTINKVLKDTEIERKIKERNALEDEILVRNKVEYIMDNFAEEPDEGLIAIMVGSNRQKTGARESVALSQLTYEGLIKSSFIRKLETNQVFELFDKLNLEGERKIANVIWELSRGTEEANIKQPKEFIKLGKVIHEFSESLRQKLNDRGANIGFLEGWIVRQSHDHFKARDAANVLKIKKNPNVKDKSFDRNKKAWKDFIIPLLDDRTFSGVEDKDEFLDFVYNTIIGNRYLIADGASGSYGSKNIPNSLSAKRVLHFKNSDAWYQYNKNFGVGNLKETVFSGINTTARNLGMMDGLGTSPRNNFEKIKSQVARQLIKQGKSIDILNQDFNKYLDVVDGSVNGIHGGFGLAKYSAIVRSIQNMGKLGGAVISAGADLGLYASEVNYQGRGFFSGMAEALGSLFRIKNTKQKRDIAEQAGFVSDSAIYDLSTRYSIGDNLNKSFTKIQRTFFKLNLLNWWTNTLKEGSILGMLNYFAKQKNLPFNKLNKRLQGFFDQFNIDAKKWEILRRMDVDRADDGKEFFSVKNVDKLSDQDVLDFMGVKSASPRQLRNLRESMKSDVSGIFIDRSTFAVIEPDARVRATMTQGTLAGTPVGEVLRFFWQFKGFPMAIVNKALGREASFFRNNQKFRGAYGIGAILLSTTLLGYMSMTAKDFFRNKKPRDPLKPKTFLSALLQGGGLGIYGDFLFAEIKNSGDIASRLAGPALGNIFELMAAMNYAIRGEGTKASRQLYNTLKGNVPFLNLFYTKTAFDYMIGYQIMEILSPGIVSRMERQMEKDYGQEFLLTKPSSFIKGF